MSNIVDKDLMDKTRRDMEICNACRYCESICPVFPEITRFRTFKDEDLNYFANLCHNCKGCYYGCQYAPPHDFEINIPQEFAKIRVQTYAKYAFPKSLGTLFVKNGTLVGIVMAICIAVVLFAGFYLTNDSFFQTYSGVGSFYHIIPQKLMTGVSMLVCLYACLAFYKGFATFWTENGDKMSELKNISLWKSALKDVATLQYLGGGSEHHGCTNENDRYSQNRRWFHQCLMYGFILTFISTSIAAIYHYGFGWHAPYDFFSLPVIFGTIGGIMILIGTVGLVGIKKRMDDKPVAKEYLGMEYSFIILVSLVSFTGLALLFLRDTSLMPLLLCVHLGFVLAFFMLLPYSKFVHALYRLGALLKYAKYKK